MPSSHPLEKILPFRPLKTLDQELDTLIKKEGVEANLPQMVDPNTYVGIEVEVEQVLTGNSLLPFTKEVDGVAVSRTFLWFNKEDGSLRNNGREFVSVPIRGKHIPYAIEKLHEKLHKDKNCKGHEFSERTSVHVHVNARDLNFEQVNNVLLTYLAVEPILYAFCGGNRHKNIFCVPLNQTNLETQIGNLFKINDKYMNLLSIWKKYTGFNLKPITTMGTIEFRHMLGTIEVDRLLIWINLLLSLRTYAKNISFDTLKEKVINLNTTSEYTMFVREVFGQYAEQIMVDDLHQQMEEMVIFVKDCFSTSSSDDVYKLFHRAGVFTDKTKAKESKWIKNLISSKVASEIKENKKGVLGKNINEWRFDDVVEAVGAGGVAINNGMRGNRFIAPRADIPAQFRPAPDEIEPLDANFPAAAVLNDGPIDF